MKLWFCETCGKRVTDDDLAQNKGRDKQVKGVYCFACAVGIQTETFEAIQLPMPEPAAEHAPVAITPMKPAIAPHKVSRPRPAAEPMREKSAPYRGQPLSAIGLMAISAVVLIVLAGVLFFMNSHAGQTPPPPEMPPHVKPVAGPSVLPPAPIPVPAPPMVPIKNGTPDNGTQELSGDQQAEAAFERLQKSLAALPEQDKAGRIALAAAFVKEHGDTILAGRARAMISGWREPAVAVGVQPAPNSFTSLLGKDESAWIVRSKSKDYALAEGEMVIGPTFDGMLDCPLKMKDFVLELEFFYENKTGGGLQITTAFGSLEFDRGSSDAWNTVQVTARSGKLSARTISGNAVFKLQADSHLDDDTLRIYTFPGTQKTFRAIRIAEIKP